MFENLEDFFVDEAKKGISVRWADILFGKYFLYALTPQNKLYPCVIYQATLNDCEYKTSGKPPVHFCNCEADAYEKDAQYLKAKIQHDVFDFYVKSGVRFVKEFYDIELPLCTQCCEELGEKINHCDDICVLWRGLFSDKDMLREEIATLQKHMSLDSCFCAMDFTSRDNYFILSYKDAHGDNCAY